MKIIKVVKKLCIECKREFEVSQYKSESANFCSKDCYHIFKGKNQIIKNCKICGKEFKVSPSRKNTANFCSYDCKKLFKIKDKVKKICETCGKEFYIRKSRAEKTKYCSVICRGIGLRGKNSPHFKEKIRRICEICGCEFYIYPSALKKDAGKFCSRECYYKFESISKCGENNYMYGKSSWSKGIPMRETTKQKLSEIKKGVPIHTEEYKQQLSIKYAGEGNPFFGKKHEEGFHTGENNPFFGKNHTEESKQIMSKSHIGQLREDNNPNWNGGITPLRKAIRESREMYEWKKKVFEKDDYTDWYTGLKGGPLEAHHIIRFEDLLRKYNITTLDEARNCKELWDVNNGITMRRDVHRAHHDLWG